AKSNAGRGPFRWRHSVFRRSLRCTTLGLAAGAWSAYAVQALWIANREALDHDQAAAGLTRVEAKLIAAFQHRGEKDGVLERDLCRGHVRPVRLERIAKQCAPRQSRGHPACLGSRRRGHDTIQTQQAREYGGLLLYPQ